MAYFISDSEEQTGEIAAALAAEAARGDVYLLEGTLGAGKSVFARAFVRALCGADTDVPSPTFTLVQTYDSAKGTLWHFDLYRLNDPEEIYDIGWEEALSGGILLVEWPQRLGSFIPHRSKRISIEAIDADSRRITTDD
jgi:tRNA threonylcarbamoyladenosine biosynthesis protein TsaE